MQNKGIGIYVHIPFCVRKCLYCDFLSAPADDDTRERYVNALCREIACGKTPAGLLRGETVNTVFFGGGTPSLLSIDQMERIMKSIRENYPIESDAELSIEVNPGTVTAEFLTALRANGFNRLSIGLQSAHDEELRALGRIHTWDEFCTCFMAARAAGFRNINVDLMSALPGQTVETWCDSMEQVLALEPEHISAYSLIIEEGTPFWDRYGEPAASPKKNRVHDTCYPPLPEEEEERLMYEKTGERLAAAGYRRYEISNYAKEGYVCKHNCTYWKRGAYIGFGLGASSFYKETRWKNVEELCSYLAVWSNPNGRTNGNSEQSDVGTDAVFCEVTELTQEESMAEFMFLGLRMTEGVSEEEFEYCFRKKMQDVYGAILEKQRKQGLIVCEDGRWKLTPYGVDVSNVVFLEYI